MDKEFHKGNRERAYREMKPNSLWVMFSGTEVCKTNDEQYPFYTDRNFLYLTGLDSKEFVLLAWKDSEGNTGERIYILPPDLMKERWTGERIKPDRAAELSGIGDVAFVESFEADFHKLASLGNYGQLYLDTYRAQPIDRETPAHKLCRRAAVDYPFLRIEDAGAILRDRKSVV